jgi:glucose/arabinose dehydrogenase
MRQRRTTRTSASILGVVLAAIIAGTTPASAGAPPPLDVIEVAALDQPVGFTFTPSGRIVYLERATGEIHFLDPSTGADRLFFKIQGVNSEGERGALGVALHPDWPAKPFVYVYVSRTPPGASLRNQVLRLRWVDGRGRHLRVLFESPIGSRSNHNGGRLLAGPDRALYLVIGDGGEDPSTAQAVPPAVPGERRGKILRFNPNGSPTAGNPFPGSRILSYGHRNSFGMAFDPVTGELWETENGPSCNDEINLITPGDNYGWGPIGAASCPDDPSTAVPEDTNQDGPSPHLPITTFGGPTIAPTGIVFCHGCGLGAFYEDDLFAGCTNGTCAGPAGPGPIMHADLDSARTAIAGGVQRVPLPGFNGQVYSMEAGPGGRLFFSGPGGIFRLQLA